jgi:hypothetical protein
LWLEEAEKLSTVVSRRQAVIDETPNRGHILADDRDKEMDNEQRLRPDAAHRR